MRRQRCLTRVVIDLTAIELDNPLDPPSAHVLRSQLTWLQTLNNVSHPGSYGTGLIYRIEQSREIRLQ